MTDPLGPIAMWLWAALTIWTCHTSAIFHTFVKWRLLKWGFSRTEVSKCFGAYFRARGKLIPPPDSDLWSSDGMPRGHVGPQWHTADSTKDRCVKLMESRTRIVRDVDLWLNIQPPKVKGNVRVWWKNRCRRCFPLMGWQIAIVLFTVNLEIRPITWFPAASICFFSSWPLPQTI